MLTSNFPDNHMGDAEFRLKSLERSPHNPHQHTGDCHHPILEGLAQPLEHMALARQPFVQQQDSVVCQRHAARHGDLATGDQSDIEDGVMWSATRASGHHRGAGMVSRTSARRIAG